MRKIRWFLVLLLPLWACARADIAKAQEVVIGGAVGGAVAAPTGSIETVNIGAVGPYTPWHSGYYHVAWGQPVALVVPPTATHQTNWGWGVGNTRVTPIYPQFSGPITAVPSQYPYGRTLPTPYYVSDTLQFGVYYIRGPW